MSYQVALLNFEGPLDLLLQLIERAEMEITNISLADLTTQYLDYIGQINGLEPDELNRFLSVAARLIYIKSLALLPQAAVAEDEEAIDLNRQLSEYARYQKAANSLRQLLQLREVSYERAASPPAVERPLPKLQIDQLRQVYGQMVAKLPQQAAVNAERLSIEQAISRLRAKLGRQTEIELAELFNDAGDRATALVFFLALLELLKNQVVAVSQDGQFQPIRVRACLS